MDTYAYFFDGLDANLSEVTMLDYSNNSQTNTYKALPIEFKGLDKTAATKMPQPTMLLQILLSVFKNAVDSIDYENLQEDELLEELLYENI